MVVNDGKVSVHDSVNALRRKAKETGFETAFDRYEKQVKQCNFGLNGTCCHACHSGPCRVTATKRGICGADVDLVAARIFTKMVASGQAAQLSHAWRFSQVLLDTANGKTSYGLKASEKDIRSLADRLNIEAEGRASKDIITDIASLFLSTLAAPNGSNQPILRAFLPARLIDKWEKLGILPANSSYELAQSVSRSSFGVEADAFELLLQAVRLGITDGSDIFICALSHDLLQGKFKPSPTKADFGVLKKDAVNIAVQGHVPLLPVVLCELVSRNGWRKKAVQAGAKEGINVVGICCSAHEMLGRYGIPLAASVMQQELAITTGALDAYVVEQQCVFPSLANLAQCFSTALITTDPAAHIPGADRLDLDDAKVYQQAEEVIGKAIEAFKNRDGERAFIPDETAAAVGVFATENILAALGGTVEPLVQAIANNQIRGIAVVGTCNNPKVRNDLGNDTILKGLIANDVLTLTTGCAAHAAAKSGLLDPHEGLKFAGPGLAALAKNLGVPPVLHAGSCIYNSLLVSLAGQIAESLDVNISDLPLAVSAPEWVSYKAISQGTFLVASGVLVHVGVVPPVIGSQKVTQILTSDIEGLLGGKVYVETDPDLAVKGLLAHLNTKRNLLIKGQAKNSLDKAGSISDNIY